MHAFATVLFSNSYLPGALQLGRALQKYDPNVKRVVLVTEQVSPANRQVLGELFQIRLVEPISGPETEQLELLGRPNLKSAFLKLRVWQLVEYKRVVYLDADTLPVASLEHLFDVLPLGYDLAAAPDCGWPDCFNSGVMVLEPNNSTFERLLEMVHAGSSFDGSDQGLLNEYFEAWHRLSFTYNVTSSSNYQYLPALERYRDKIKVYHYIGEKKPWMQASADPKAELAPHIFQDKPYEEMPVVDESKLIQPDPYRWDPVHFEPPVISRPEAPKFEERNQPAEPITTAAPSAIPERSPSPPHAFSMGPAVVKFPWEDKKIKPTRRF